MGTEKFEIGQKEKHYVTVQWSILSKHLKIERDDAVIADKMHLTPSPEQVEFDVGASEPHHVLVIAGGFSATEVRVDGTKVEPLP